MENGRVGMDPASKRNSLARQSPGLAPLRPLPPAARRLRVSWSQQAETPTTQPHGPARVPKPVPRELSPSEKEVVQESPLQLHGLIEGGCTPDPTAGAGGAVTTVKVFLSVSKSPNGREKPGAEGDTLFSEQLLTPGLRMSEVNG